MIGGERNGVVAIAERVARKIHNEMMTMSVKASSKWGKGAGRLIDTWAQSLPCRGGGSVHQGPEGGVCLQRRKWEKLMKVGENGRGWGHREKRTSVRCCGDHSEHLSEMGCSSEAFHSGTIGPDFSFSVNSTESACPGARHEGTVLLGT